MTENIQCRAIIFDFDGTLADSMPFLAQIGVEVMMKYYGVSKEEAAERYKFTTGLPYEHQIKLNFPNNERNDEAIEVFERMKIDRIFEQRLFPEAEAAVTNLNRKGFLIFVSSSTFQSTITEYFKRMNLLDQFKEILGYRPGFEKGADHFNHVKNRYDIPIDEIVFIGDSLKDYERTRGFCSFVGVSGMFSEADFREAGHIGPVIEDLSHLEGLISLLE